MKSAICLSNTPLFDWENHFLSRQRQGAIKELNIEGSKARFRLPDGRWVAVIVLPKERKVDVALSSVHEVASYDSSLFREVVFAIEPLWACCNETISTLRPLHTTLSHICSVPHIAQYSYWGEPYVKLFSNGWMLLERSGLGSVKRLGNGVWVEVSSSSEEDHLAKTHIIEKYLTDIDIWDGGKGRSEAVQMALLKQCSMEKSLRDLALWRQEHKNDAVSCYSESVEAARLAISDFGRNCREGYVCSIISRAEDGVAWFWIKGTGLEVLRMTCDRTLVGKIAWSAVLHNLKKTREGIFATIEILNSCAEVVMRDELHVCRAV